MKHALGSSSSTPTAMLASQNRLLSGSRIASFKQPQPFVAAGRSRCQPTIVANAKLAPLVDAIKADQIRTDLPPVSWKTFFALRTRQAAARVAEYAGQQLVGRRAQTPAPEPMQHFFDC